MHQTKASTSVKDKEAEKDKKAVSPKEPSEKESESSSSDSNEDEVPEHEATANYMRKQSNIISSSTNKRELLSIMEGEFNYNSKMQRS